MHSISEHPNVLDLKVGIDPSTIVAEDFNTTLSAIDRSSTQKTNKESAELNCIPGQTD
jgi:hypothetical protein